jgi:uncharacterized membrane protein SirB2
VNVDPDAPKLGRVSAAFLLAAAIAILFNTVLACAKDAYSPLRTLMTALSDHDWTTQGLADVLLFVALGLIFLKTRLPEALNPNRAVSFLVAAVVISGVGLFAWYALH